MLERRRVRRTRILKPAAVIAGHRSPHVYECLVRDVTSFGARIELTSTALLPNIFELTFDSFRTMRGCHVIWRTTSQVGVEFSLAQPGGGQAAAET